MQDYLDGLVTAAVESPLPKNIFIQFVLLIHFDIYNLYWQILVWKIFGSGDYIMVAAGVIMFTNLLPLIGMHYLKCLWDHVNYHGTPFKVDHY